MPEEELIYSIAVTFDAIHSGRFRVDLAEAEHFPVARRHQVADVIHSLDRSSTLSQLSGEELVER